MLEHLKWSLFLVAAGVVCLLIVIILFGVQDDIHKADVIVVFGNTVYPDGSLSARLQARMDRGIELFFAGMGDYLLVSGALGKEGVEESAAMKSYAMQRGVPEERILQDAQGVDTEATAKNTSLLLESTQASSVILVSQFFHLLRADRTFAAAGIQQRGHSFARYVEPRDVYSLGRELVALPVYELQRLRKQTGILTIRTSASTSTESFDVDPTGMRAKGYELYRHGFIW